jgi:hypothetical protein
MKAYIYKVKRKDSEKEIYIGQTIQPLNKRLDQHFYKLKKVNPEFKSFLYTNGKENIEIIPIEEYDYENILDIQTFLNERENYWTNFYKNNPNYICYTKISGNANRIYYDLNERQEYKKQVEKEYREKNKERIHQRDRLRYRNKHIKKDKCIHEPIIKFVKIPKIKVIKTKKFKETDELTQSEIHQIFQKTQELRQKYLK